MIVRFFTGPGIPSTIWPVAIHGTWDEAIGAVAALGGCVMTVDEKRKDEIMAKIGKCHCGNDAQQNNALCEQCERALIDTQKPTWAVKGRENDRQTNQKSA